MIYSIIALVYGIGQYVLLKFAIIGEHFKNRTTILIHKSTVILQYVLLGILTISVVQMIFISSYNSVILKTVTWINYTMSIVFLGLLAKKFIMWFSSKKNKVLVAYAIAMILLCMSSALSIVDISYEVTIRAPEYIQPTKSSLATIWDASNLFNTTYFITSVLAFVSTWFATVLLLAHYSAKIGKAKYWIIVSIPLIYFLSQFQPLLINLFTPFRVAEPILFGISYTFVFSATKPVGGILFGIAFWVASRGLSNRQVKDYMLISGCGLLLLFTANQHQVLLLNPYPPFGLPTISYIGLASYFVLVGVYSSALSVANDAELRRSIRKSIQENSDIIGNIGEAQFEDQLQKEVIKKTRDLSYKIIEETGIASSLEERDIHEYVIMAINEAKRARSTSSN